MKKHVRTNIKRSQTNDKQNNRRTAAVAGAVAIANLGVAAARHGSAGMQIFGTARHGIIWHGTAGTEPNGICLFNCCLFVALYKKDIHFCVRAALYKKETFFDFCCPFAALY